MAIRFYDEALVEKIQKWIADPNLRILKPNEVQRLWQTIADDNDDKPIKLPLIAISRDPSVNINITTKRPLSFDGVKISEYDGKDLPEKQKIMHLDGIPITLNYQIDIYTRKYDQGDEYLRNFIFNFINHPKMKIHIPYNGSNIEHICYTRLQSTASDNSDIPQKLFADQFTRWTLLIRIDDAYLFSVPVDEGAKIDQQVGFYVVDPEINYESREIIEIDNDKTI